MKVVFLATWVTRKFAGVFEAARRLAQCLAELPETTVEVFGLEDEFVNEDIGLWAPLRPRVFPIRGPAVFGYAAGLERELAASNADVVHVHGLWTYFAVAARNWGRRFQRPVVISPHGMLDPWAVRNSRWKKRLAAFAYQDAALREAACLHVLNTAEREAVRAYGCRNPLGVIPYGIDLPGGPPECAPPWNGRVEPGSRVALSLGRLHPKKNLANLLRGWALFRSQTQAAAGPWRLVIAGWDQGGYEQELKALADELGLRGEVVFLGPQFGEAKEAAFARADAFVIPSHSEGLPIVVLEAWARGKPVVMTPGCNVPEGFEARAALKVGTDPESIAAGLSELAALPPAEREAIGQRGRALVRERYTWPGAARQLREVYAWLLGGRTVPSCVRVD
jgi:poly(glycerol-phosphate) alpha-glucosyltransferase